MEEDQQFEYTDPIPQSLLFPNPPSHSPPYGKQPQRRLLLESPRDPPPHFDLDTGDHDDQDPPVDPDDPGADNNHDDLDDDSAVYRVSKVKEPEVFDGSDPRKLKTFFVNLALVFNDRPKYFTDQRKVNYTLSYLSGSAKEWFVPDILDPDLDSLPAWTSSFKALVKELQDNFGVYDAQGEAEDSLGNLKMKETENIRKYNIRFNTLAASTNWDSAALKWAYGRGLAERIKDEMARLPEPATLVTAVLLITSLLSHSSSALRHLVAPGTVTRCT
ncbi:hypothetical protein LENED_010979 [Lentinula edodes]|uniref:Retrotransposon gag domain-containing protein n=1 Tax=Lentinula edodes TaxID=5353 RepID=A0A1Q3ENV6_LENED|nr:hypothetical protein LENED_010979 [Lentinula edodes]